jgi:hypothetical protein
MFKKNLSPDFQGEADIAPVPEAPPISAEDLGQEFNPSTPPKNNLMLFISIGIAIVIALIGGVVFASYQGYLDISFLPSKKNKIVDETLVAMQTVKQAKYNVGISSKIEPWDGIHTPIEEIDDNVNGLAIGASSVMDAVIDMQIQLSVESYFDGTADLEAMNGYITLNGIYGDSTMQWGLEIELRKVGPDIYGKVSDYPELVAIFVPQLEELKGKWIKLTTADKYGEYLDMAYEYSNMVAETNPVTNYDLAFETGFLKLGKKLDSEVVDGQPTMHYEVVIDMNKFESMYIKMLAEVTKLQENVSMEGLENFNLEESLTPEMRSSLDAIVDNLMIEVWISETDNVIRQAKATMITVLPEAQRTDEIGQARIEVLVNLSNINETIDVSEPQSAMTIDELMQIFSPEVDKTDTDEDGLSDKDEEKYGTDINNKDTDGDGYEDGSEVENGYNPAGEGILPMPIELDTTSIFDVLE